MEPLMKPAAEPAQNAALLRLVARREHNLLALMELCRHLAQAADLVRGLEHALVDGIEA